MQTCRFTVVAFTLSEYVIHHRISYATQRFPTDCSRDHHMSLSQSTEQNIGHVFREGFSARDIAEPLASFDDSTDVKHVHHFMIKRPLSVVGIRQKGLVVGYVCEDKIDDRPLHEQMSPLQPDAIVDETASFQEIILKLDERPFLLVTFLGQPIGVITHDDMQKAPVRMWLFGMVTLIEMRLTRMIKFHHRDESWLEFVSESRVAKARELYTERTRRNQSIDLLDCLQFSDKGQIVAKSEPLRGMIYLESRRKIEKAAKNLERLRNTLAHSQDLTADHWDAILGMAKDLDGILRGPSNLQIHNSHTPFESMP